MQRDFEPGLRPFPEVRFADVLAALAAADLMNLSLMQFLGVIEFVLNNPAAFQLYFRSCTPRAHLGERSAGIGWITLMINCFQNWQQFDNVHGPPMPYDALRAVLPALASLFGLDNLPSGFATRVHDALPAPPAVAGFEPIRPPLLLLTRQIECSLEGCQRRALHVGTAPGSVVDVFAVRNSLCHFAQAVPAVCSSCHSHYRVDNSSSFIPGSVNRRTTFVNDAPFLRVGDSLYADETLATALDSAIYLFHGNMGSFANFVSDTFGLPASLARYRFEFSQRHAKSLFLQSSVRRVARSIARPFSFDGVLGPDDLAQQAYDQLANPEPGVNVLLGGYFPSARRHACDVCHKSVLVPVGPAGHAAVEAPVYAAPPHQGEVNCVAVDGIVCGPLRCSWSCTRMNGNYRETLRCPRPPANVRSSPLCTHHLATVGDQCHMVDCLQPVVPLTKACALHQAQWRNYQDSNRDDFGTMASFARRILRARQQPDLAWVNRPDQRAQPAHDALERTEAQQAEDRPNYFKSRRYYCLENCVHACGTPIAWSLFPYSESYPNIARFITSIWADHLQPGAPKRPSYLVVDKACGLLRHLVTSGAWLIWMVTTRFKVDRFHWRNHSQRDALCQQWCNMAPTDGSDPNLVRRVMVNGTERHIGQFNSEAQEQLNVWLAGYEPVFKRMGLAYFLWFVHALLHLRLVKMESGRGGNLAHDGSQGGDDDVP